MTFSLQIWNVTPIQTVNITRVEVQKRLIVHLEAAIVKVCFFPYYKLHIFSTNAEDNVECNLRKTKCIYVELEPSSCFF